MATPSVGLAIVTYNGFRRVGSLLESLNTERGWLDRVLISEDPCPYPEVRERLIGLANFFKVDLNLSDTWGCMQGNATRAMKKMNTDVVILMSDDVLVTPGSMKAVRRFWERYWHYPIGCAQTPYWGSWDDVIRFGFIHHPDEFYVDWESWIKKIPRNAHWEGTGVPRSYVNVHGCCFSIRKDVWTDVGGFSPTTWCYDEDIAAKVWLHTPLSVVCHPGAPVVHYGGASQCGNEHPETTAHTLDAWVKDWGADKPEIHARIREKMTERAFLDEYFQRNGFKHD